LTLLSLNRKFQHDNIATLKHKNPPHLVGFCASKGLVLPLKSPFLGLFWGVFTGFYKNAKSYVIEY
jgi:hypothetical protein